MIKYYITTEHRWKPNVFERKVHFTRGTFNRWERGGPFNFIYAVIHCQRSAILIPRQDLTPESLIALPPIPEDVLHPPHTLNAQEAACAKQT